VGVGFVLAVALVFLWIGEGEDRARARGERPSPYERDDGGSAQERAPEEPVTRNGRPPDRPPLRFRPRKRR
jgi:hypothetical protein